MPLKMIILSVSLLMLASCGPGDGNHDPADDNTEAEAVDNLYVFNDQLNLTYFKDQNDLTSYEILGSANYDSEGISHLMSLVEGRLEANSAGAWEMCYPGLYDRPETQFMDCLVSYKPTPDAEKHTIKQHQVLCQDIPQDACFVRGNGVIQALKDNGQG